MNAKEIKNKKWIKHWAGHWSFLSSTYLGYQYTHLLNKSLGYSLKYSAFLTKKGYTTCLLSKDDHKKFGLALVKKVKNNPKLISKWCNNIKKETDVILNIIKKLEKEEITSQDYAIFLKTFFAYGSTHRAIKIIVDYLEPKLLEKFLPKMEEARIYAEPVYEKTEKFMEIFAKQISKKEHYLPEIILCMTKAEFDIYLNKDKLPSKKTLAERYKNSVIVYKNGILQIFCGKEAISVRALIEKIDDNSKIISGNSAYPGKIIGKVKIVLNPEKVTNFKEGEILVTGMTRPEYLELFKKSGAVLTDAGGVLCHAAITAREIKKPTIVGVQIATKVLKDGDLVEVDANHGIIKILNN